MRFQTFRRLAFLALFAMVFNALAATVSYAMAAGKGVVVVEMCSSFGLKKVAISTTYTDLRILARCRLQSKLFCVHWLWPRSGKWSAITSF